MDKEPCILELNKVVKKIKILHLYPEELVIGKQPMKTFVNLSNTLHQKFMRMQCHAGWIMNIMSERMGLLSPNNCLGSSWQEISIMSRVYSRSNSISGWKWAKFERWQWTSSVWLWDKWRNKDNDYVGKLKMSILPQVTRDSAAEGWDYCSKCKKWGHNTCLRFQDDSKVKICSECKTNKNWRHRTNRTSFVLITTELNFLISHIVLFVCTVN